MIKPTKKNQKQWVKDHLNGGSFPEGKREYYLELIRNGKSPYGNACYEAMVWLDENNIKSLEEAWDKCPDLDWLDWMLDRMDLTEDEILSLDKAWDSLYTILDIKKQLKEFKKRLPNPWRSK